MYKNVNLKELGKSLQKDLNPIGDIPTLPFSSERKIYKDDVWNFIDDFLTKKSL